MQRISRKAQVVCATIATLTSATLLASTLIGLTSPEPAAVSMAHAPAERTLQAGTVA